MNPVLLRPALPDDLDAITSIYSESVLHGTASYELEPPTRAEMQARYETLAAGQYPYIVAEQAGKILGYAYAGPFRPRLAYRFSVEDSVYLAPDAQGKGVGRLLLRRLVDDATAQGFRQMIAVIGDGSDRSASVRLHAALGFTPAGRLVGSGYKHGRWLDTVFMQLAMNGGNETPPDLSSMPERRFRGEA